MFGKSKNQPKPSAANWAKDYFAKASAGIITFFVTGPIYWATLPFIQDFAANTYSEKLIGVVSVGWFGFVGMAVFAFFTLVIALLTQIISVMVSKLPWK